MRKKFKKINQWSKLCVRCTYSELAMILGDGGDRDVVEVVKRFPLTSVLVLQVNFPPERCCFHAEP